MGFSQRMNSGVSEVFSGLVTEAWVSPGWELPLCCHGTCGVCGLLPLSCVPSWGELGSPPCPRGGSVSVTSSPLQSAVWAFKETFLSSWSGTTVNICLEGGEGGKALCVGCLFRVDPFPLPGPVRLLLGAE